MSRTLTLAALTVSMMLAAAGSASAHHCDSLLAPTSICPGQTDTRRSVDDQERTMRCSTTTCGQNAVFPSAQVWTTEFGYRC